MLLEVGPIAFVGTLAGLWWSWRLHSRRTGGELPAELRTARLIYAERLFRAAGPVSITAKVDRVYRSAAGELVLLELKTRRVSRTYLSDIIELSAQRVAVMAQTKEPVAGYAYVLTQRPDGRWGGCHRVGLMALADVYALAVRRELLLAEETEIRRVSTSLGICRRCVFLPKCRPPHNHHLRSPCN